MMEQNEYMAQFEQKLKESMQSLCRQMMLLNGVMPQTPDLDEVWPAIGQDYLVDGVREFAAYPHVSLGWMMYVGMALAHRWDADWAKWAGQEHLYEGLRESRGFDCLDEYVRQDILGLQGAAYDETEQAVRACARHALDALRREHIAPGSKEAFLAYVAALHVLYEMGAAVELARLGYEMTAVGN